MVIKTGIAPVLSKFPHTVDPENAGKTPQKLQPVPRPRDIVESYELDGPEREPRLCWFDEMLGKHEPNDDAGLYIPDANNRNGNRPFVMIVSGPPGSAKSTFALQICYNFARRSEARVDPPRPAALYITTETTSKQIIEKATGFGWEGSFSVLETLKDPDYGSNIASTCYIHAASSVVPSDESREPSQYEAAHPDTMTSLGVYQGPHPEILVIDSFNTLPNFDLVSEYDGDQGNHPVSHLMRFCRDPKAMRPRLVIVVLDVESGDNHLTKRFGFFADATIRLDMADDGGILQRTIEIIKIKSQKHAEGKHAIKIFQKPLPVKESERSPFLRVGGLFVFPSIPWYCDHVREYYKDIDGDGSTRNSLPPLKVLPEGALKILAAKDSSRQGFVPGHTISFVGSHGTLKQRFAYGCLLQNVIKGGKGGKSGLIVSLRADRNVVVGILADIVKAEFPEYWKAATEKRAGKKWSDLDEKVREKSAVEAVEQLFYEDKLGFVYYDSAYITPGEFFHRVYAAYNRPRLPERGRIEFVVVDGLDQIESKFPLCAREKLFVSALVTLFKADQKACAIFISAHEPTLDATSSESSLYPQSDLVLRFADFEDRHKCIESLMLDLRLEQHERPVQLVEVHAVRVPFAEITEPKGILWAPDQKNLSPEGAVWVPDQGKLRFNILGSRDTTDPGNRENQE